MTTLVDIVFTYWYIVVWLYLGLSILVYAAIEGKPPLTFKEILASLIVGFLVIGFVVLGSILSIIGTIIVIIVGVLLSFLAVPVWLHQLLTSKIR